MNDPPPRHAAAPQRHHPADLARAARSEELRDVSVRHHLASRDGIGDVQDARREVVRLGPPAHCRSVGRRGWSRDTACRPEDRSWSRASFTRSVVRPSRLERIAHQACGTSAVQLRSITASLSSTLLASARLPLPSLRWALMGTQVCGRSGDLNGIGDGAAQTIRPKHWTGHPAMARAGYPTYLVVGDIHSQL